MLPWFTSVDGGVRNANLSLFMTTWPKPMGPLASLWQVLGDIKWDNAWPRTQRTVVCLSLDASAEVRFNQVTNSISPEKRQLLGQAQERWGQLSFPQLWSCPTKPPQRSSHPEEQCDLCPLNNESRSSESCSQADQELLHNVSKWCCRRTEWVERTLSSWTGGLIITKLSVLPI